MGTANQTRVSKPTSIKALCEFEDTHHKKRLNSL